MMMGRLYKNENLARVQSYEIYRTVLLNLLSSKRIWKKTNFHFSLFQQFQIIMESIQKYLRENPHIHIADDKRSQVEQTIRSLINDGRKLLHVVADFDFTLTMYEKNNLVLPSTFGVIEDNDEIRVRRSNPSTDLSTSFSFSCPMEHYYTIVLNDWD